MYSKGRALVHAFAAGQGTILLFVPVIECCGCEAMGLVVPSRVVVGAARIAACVHALVCAPTLREGERGLCVTFQDGIGVFMFGAWRATGQRVACLLNYPPPTSD